LADSSFWDEYKFSGVSTTWASGRKWKNAEHGIFSAWCSERFVLVCFAGDLRPGEFSEFYDEPVD
jgi:hypothetical protein